MDDAAVFRQGRSLLHEALSPSSKQLLQDFFEATDDATASPHLDADDSSDSDGADDGEDRAARMVGNSNHRGDDRPSALHAGAAPRLSTPSPSRRVLSTAAAVLAQNSKNFVQIECASRPFCLQLSANSRGEIVVAGFTPDPVGGGGPGTIESTGLVHAGDVLVAVNNEMDALTTVDATARILMRAALPAVLTFRRVAVVHNSLGEYTREEIARNLLLHDSRLVALHGLDAAAAMVKACIDVLDDRRAVTPLLNYVQRLEQLLVPPSYATTTTPTPEAMELWRRRREELADWLDRIHKFVDTKQKDHVKKWNSTKAANYKRIEVLSKQRDSIRSKLDKMRSNPALLVPENHSQWQEFIELRHLASQLQSSVETAKQSHFLPDFEGYALRFGSDGVYIGLGDLWVSSFRAKFTVETRTTAPQVFFHLSSPSSHGLQLRITNFKLATEGRLPSFHCDELTIETLIVADVPFHFDAITGWSVPADQLHVKVQSFSYYERRANSVKRGVDHDTVIKLFINRLLPSVVRQAAQQLFCVEIGPLLESKNAQLMLTGELRMDGRPLELYDAALNSSATGATASTSNYETQLRHDAQELMGLSTDEGDALCELLKSVETSTKKRGAVTSEHSNLSIRVLQHYFAQFKGFPNVKVLATELWHQSLQLLLRERSSAAEHEPSPVLPDTSFPAVLGHLEQLEQYPVDVAVSLSDVTFRLDLCEAAATYYTTLQRIIRHRMDSIAVGLANMDAMKDGSFLENELASLDDWYEKVNRVLSYLTINVDDLGVVLRGALPAGLSGQLAVAAQDLACKGPCAGTFTVPLTDFATLQQAMAARPKSARGGDSGEDTDVFSALLHERDALVFAKFFRVLQEHVADCGDADDSPTEDADDVVDKMNAALYRDRVAVSVKNARARVLFEVPTDPSTFEPGATIVPFSCTLVTHADEPPHLKVETGEFAKCQYKVEQVRLTGPASRIIQRSRSAATDATAASRDDSSDDVPSEQQEDSAASGGSSASVWREYLASPAFSLRFHFFTSCQVTRDHIFGSLRSASLSHPTLVQLRHRVSLVEVLQDIGMISLVEHQEQGRQRQQRLAKRRQDARFRRALQRRWRAGDDVSKLLDDDEVAALSAVFSRPGSVAETADYEDEDRMSVSSRQERMSSRMDSNNTDASAAAASQEDSHRHSLATTAPVRAAPSQASYEKQTSVFF
ncbi:hypothetical protein ATCC90586_010587 [Pythium insidiosum]|nr:hypothetical protein ATCC90586_010587 [Pythium insidiosum]